MSRARTFDPGRHCVHGRPGLFTASRTGAGPDRRPDPTGPGGLAALTAQAGDKSESDSERGPRPGAGGPVEGEARQQLLKEEAPSSVSAAAPARAAAAPVRAATAACASHSHTLALGVRSRPAIAARTPPA